MTYDENLQLIKRENAMKLWRKTFIMKIESYSVSEAVVKADAIVEEFYKSFNNIDNG